MLLSKSNGKIEFDINLIGPDFGANGGPYSIDIDGDGDLDFIISKGSAASIYLFKNNGDASFDESYLNISGTNIFKFGDLEGDGDLDIIGLNKGSKTINTYQNDGEGNFSLKESIKVSGSVVSISISSFDVGHLDNDNNLDIVVSLDEFFGEELLIYSHNNETSSFEKQVIASHNFDRAKTVILEDLDQDGLIDIIANTSSALSCWFNIGNLKFERKDLAQNSIGGAGWREMAMSDYDLDGSLDFVIGSQLDQIVWLKNISSNPFLYEERNIGSANNTFAIKNGDFDQDGDFDFLTNVPFGNVRVYENIISTITSTSSIPILLPVVYPNPFIDKINIYGYDKRKIGFRLRNIDGSVVIQSKSIYGAFDLNELPTGAYIIEFINIENRAIIHYEKLVKQ